MKERLVRTRRTAARSLATLCSPAGLSGAALEAAWLATHVVLYPWGFLGSRTRLDDGHRTRVSDLPPVHRALLLGDVEAAGTPIILVHGMADNRSIFTLLHRSLRRRGFGRVVALNYSVLTGNVPRAAERLARRVEELCTETGYERVHVIGHSMGGLIARWYVQRLGGDARVHTLVTLGSPHGGTWAARLLPLPVGRQLLPTSTLITELSEPAPGCTTRFLAFWSDLDELIVPKRGARLDHPDLAARNVLLRGVGHLSLPINRRVVHEIAATLAHLDQEGQTITAGVTPIDALPAAATGPSAPQAGRSQIPGGQSFSSGA
ncbi:MAG: esterase/lipase family protein [Mycobacteriales bacterium]